jgi:hypothetical protein
MGGEGRCSMKRLMTVILVSLLACPLSFSETRQSAERQAPSEAMARQLQEVLAPLAEKAVENRLTAADYATMATALRMTFANWDETGFTKNLENFILSHRERFLEDQNAEQIHEGWMKVKTSLAEGSVVTEGDYARSVQRVTREDKERFLGIVKTQGLSGFQSQLVEQLEARARWAATRTSGLAQVTCYETASFWTGTASLYLSIVALAASATGPVAAGIGAVSLVLGFVSWLLC